MEQDFPRLSLAEQLRVTVWHTIPSLMGGVALGRPRVRAVLAALGVADHSLVVFDGIRDRHQNLPVWMRGPAGRTLLLLAEPAVHRVLSESDAVYSLDTVDKHRAQAEFQPDALIVSRGRLREERRALNEFVLGDVNDHGALAQRLLNIVDTETGAMVRPAATVGTMGWPELRRGFARIGRRIVLGDSARDDIEITKLLHSLRRDGNWMGLLPWRASDIARRREELRARVNGYVDRPAPGSLVDLLSDVPANGELDAPGQVPHWLTALELAAPTAARTLTLLATHPMVAGRVRRELEAADRHHGPGSVDGVIAQPYLRACVWEAIRLWPPVPNLERVTTRPVSWGAVTLPEGSTILIPAFYLARNHRRGRTADRLSPEQWLYGTAESDWTLLPFSKGPGVCPGKDLASFVIVAACAALLRRVDLRALTPRWAPDRPLPRTSDPAATRFAVSPHTAVSARQMSRAEGE